MVRPMSIVMIRWGLGAVGAAWVIYIGYLVVVETVGDRGLEHAPWRTAVLAVLVVATLGLLLERVLRHVETAISDSQARSVEFGRYLEGLRRSGANGATVLPLGRDGHAGVGR